MEMPEAGANGGEHVQHRVRLAERRLVARVEHGAPLLRQVIEPRAVVRGRELAVAEAVDEDDHVLRLPGGLEHPDLVGALAERADDGDARAGRAARGEQEDEENAARDADPHPAMRT